MNSAPNPHLISTVKCAGAACPNVRRESNHWFLITIQPGTFICRPLPLAIDLQQADKPVCGQACAQKLLENFLATTLSHSPRQQTAGPVQPAGSHFFSSPTNHPYPEDNMQPNPPRHSQSTQHANQHPVDPTVNRNPAARPSAQVALAACVYIGLRCTACGDVRQALQELPAGETTACPQCGELCSFVRLGTGQTRGELPFHEITSTPNQTPTALRETYPAASYLRYWQEA